MKKRISVALAVIAAVMALGATTPADARDSGWNGTFVNANR